MYDLTKFRKVTLERMKGKPLSEISAVVSAPRSTVRDWLNVCDRAGLNYEQLKAMTPNSFLASVNRLRQPSLTCFQPEWDSVLEDVSKKQRSLQQCFDDYVQACPREQHPMGRTTFYEHFRKLQNTLSPENRRLYLHNSFAPGSVAMIDYSGNGITYTDQDKNKERTAQLFVGVLGHSGLIFCQATVNQKRDAWLSAIADMFAAFGGVTEELWLDNATPLVVKASRVEPTLSEEFLNFSEQYDTEPRAVAPGEPTYKGLVENAVKQCQNFIVKELAGRRFFSIEEVNRAIAPELRKLNDRPLRDRPETSRRKRYEQEEAHLLRPLPAIPYAPGVECFERKVLKGDQIRIENLRYNVPWGHHGKTLIVHVDRIKRTIVCRLKDSGDVIQTTKLRTPRQGDEPTRPEHLPPEVRTLAMTRSELLEYIEGEMHLPEHDVLFAKVLGRLANSKASAHLRHLINAAKRLSREDLDAICSEVLSMAEVNIKNFDRVREKHFSVRTQEPSDGKAKTDISGEGDVSECRGAEYFKTTGETK